MSVLSELSGILSTDDPAAKAAIIADSILSSLPAETSDVARHCVLLHWFDKQIISSLLPESHKNNSEIVYEQLAVLPFIESVRWGLAYHELTREGLLKRYGGAKPDNFINTAKLVAPIYESRSEIAQIGAEAFYCYQISGESEAAIRLLDKTIEACKSKGDLTPLAYFLNAQVEAEELQFTKPVLTGSEGRTMIGFIHLMKGNRLEAIAEFDKAIEIDPNNFEPLALRGIAYSRLERYDEALVDINRAIQLQPDNARLYTELGSAYGLQGRYEDAITAYQHAIKLDPTSSSPHTYIGGVYYNLDRFEDALAEYKHAIEISPGNAAESYYGIGVVYDDLDRLDHAIAAYQKAIEIDGGFVAPHSGLGIIYKKLGRREDAIAEYKFALESDPTSKSAHNNLGEMYMEQDEFDKAQYHLNERIRLSPKTALDALVNLGIIYRYKDDPNSDDIFQRALGIWDWTWQIRQQTPFYLLDNKAIALICLGNQEEALKTIYKATRSKLPGDRIGFYRYELLQRAPNPPPGIVEMIQLLRQTDGR